MQTRRERLVAPPSWWIAAAAFAGAWAWVALVVTGPSVALVTGVAVGALVGALVWAYGSTLLVAGPDGLTVGRAHLSREHVGALEPLDSGATRALLGPDADARAWLHVRPYVDTALRVEVDDPADPAPYWIVSTRDPAALAEALGTRPDPAQPDPTRTDPR